MGILVWCNYDYKTTFFCSEAASSLLPLVFQRERDYSIVSISMSQYPITSLEWGSCRELVLLLFLARILRNNRCICMAKCKWTNEAFVLHWTMKTLCTLNCKKILSQYGLAISQTLASIISKPELSNKLLTSLTSTWAFVSITVLI